MSKKILSVLSVVLMIFSVPEKAYSQSIEDAWHIFDKILYADIDQFKKGFTHQIIIIPMGNISVPIQIERETDSVIESVCSLINEPECVQVLTDLSGLHSLDKPYETVFDDCWDDAIKRLIEGLFGYLPYKMETRLARLELVLKVESLLGGIETEIWNTDQNGNRYFMTMEEIFWKNEINAGIESVSLQYHEYELKTCEYIFGELAYENTFMIVSDAFSDFETGNDSWGICEDLRDLADLKEFTDWGDDPEPYMTVFDERARYGKYVEALWDTYREFNNDSNSCGYEDEDLDAAREQFSNASLAEQVSTLLYLFQLLHDTISEEEMKKMLRYLAAKNVHPLWDHAEGRRQYFSDRFGPRGIFQIPVPFLD